MIGYISPPSFLLLRIFLQFSTQRGEANRRDGHIQIWRRMQCDEIWRNWAKICIKFTSLWQILTAYFLLGKMLSLLWQIGDIVGLIFSVPNGKILINNPKIWSHWSHGGGKIYSQQIIRSTSVQNWTTLPSLKCYIFCTTKLLKWEHHPPNERLEGTLKSVHVWNSCKFQCKSNVFLKKLANPGLLLFLFGLFHTT